MKKIFGLIMLAVLAACSPKTTSVVTQPKPDPEAFRQKAPVPGPAPKIQLGDYQSFTLDNGLKVILVEDHNIPAINITVDIDQPPFPEGKKAGVAELAGDIIATGTSTRTKEQIDEDVDFIGAYFTAWSSGAYGNTLKKHQDKLLSIMSDVLLNPTFPQKELDKAKKRKLSGLAQQKDDPDAIASNVAAVLNFGKNHPYGELVTEETVKAVTRDDIVKFYKKFFRPNISYLVVTGDMTMEELKPLAQKYFGSWQKADVPEVELPPVHPPKTTTVAMVNKPGAVQSKIDITYPVDLKPNSPDRIKLSVANAMFGGFFGSRLNKNLREDKAYTYGAGSSIRSDRVMGNFAAQASVRNEVTDSAIVQFLYEMKRIREQAPPQDELNRVKSVLSGRFARSLENKRTLARFAVNIMKYGLPKDYYAKYLQNLSAVSDQDVLTMARKYIHPDAAHVIVVGNQGEIKDKLEGLGLPGGVKLYDIYGNEIAPPKATIEGKTAQDIIERFYQAIGGKDAVAKIKTISQTATASVQGQKITINSIGSTDGKGKIEVSMMGNVMQKMVVNGDKGYQEAGGMKKPFSSEEVKSFATNIVPVKETVFDKLGIKTKLVGIENVNGKDAYKIETTEPDGKKGYLFYDVNSGLRVQEVTKEQGMQVIVNYSDYKTVDGVKFPFKMSQNVPMPMTLEVSELKTNFPLNEADFKVE